MPVSLCWCLAAKVATKGNTSRGTLSPSLFKPRSRPDISQMLSIVAEKSVATQLVVGLGVFTVNDHELLAGDLSRKNDALAVGAEDNASNPIVMSSFLAIYDRETLTCAFGNVSDALIVRAKYKMPAPIRPAPRRPAPPRLSRPVAAYWPPWRSDLRATLALC